MPRPPLPPFTLESAIQKVRLAEDAWNSGDPARVALAYSEGHWFRIYGNENRAFDADGLMHTRIASINDLPIVETERLYHWQADRRPDGHAGLSEMGL